jgi:hypothetical protein
MTGIFKFSLAILILLIVAAGARAQTIVVDQLAATVNGDAITRSDIVWGLALDPKITGDLYSSDNMAQMLNQLIDQHLFLNEAARLPSLQPSAAEVTQEIQSLIKKFPSQMEFQKRVDQAGLTAEQLQEIVKQRLRILKYIDFRFRSFALISEDEIKNYYQETIAPKLRARGIKVDEQPSEKERNMIEAILIEDRIASETERFLDDAHSRADIVMLIKF